MTDRLPVVRKEGQNVQIPAGDGLLLRGALNEARIVNVSAAATINFDTWASNTVALQGSGTINTLIGGQKGCTRRMRFTQDGIILGNLTGNIILPGTANIVVKVNDVAEFVSLTNGQWLCFNYSRADGTALVSSGSGSSPASTDALPEGTTNLYFTAARAQAATRFTWTQSAAAAVWTVPHNTNGYPSVTVVDTLGNVVTPDISYVDANTVQITHGAAYAGKAYIN